MPGLASLRCLDALRVKLDGAFTWTSMKGVASTKRLGDVLLHVFNHQAHHRCQATTLFAQLGVDAGPTDLLLLLPDAA